MHQPFVLNSYYIKSFNNSTYMQIKPTLKDSSLQQNHYNKTNLSFSKPNTIFPYLLCTPNSEQRLACISTN